MIIDLRKFVAEEQATWTELEGLLDAWEENPERRFTLAEARRFHYLYQRTVAGLSRIEELPSERETRRYLEGLVARGFGEIHEVERRARRFRLLRWFTVTFPSTFRRHRRAFAAAAAALTVGALFGVGAMALDPEAKDVLIPFSHLMGDPAERVAEEEAPGGDDLAGAKFTFSSYLMTHNTRVAILCMAMGLTFGVGTVILLFYNGVILGAVAFDYVAAGQTPFLLGWLLPHGAVEIPAIVIGSQVGLILAAALLGRGDGRPLADRFRSVSADTVTLIFGTTILLVWAGVVESFFSQYHEPVIPYGFKIGFGVLEFLALSLFLARAGAGRKENA